MISANQNTLVAPFDASQLYWIMSAPSGATFYSPASFYFASADGSRLVPAMQDETRFIAALTDAVAQYAGYSFAPGLQKILDALTADNTPPAPVYPQIGDTNVLGTLGDVSIFPAQPHANPPVPQMYFAMVEAEVEGNGYTTPDANAMAAGEIPQFRFRVLTSA